MAYLIVKLTATGGSNSATNPGNALDSDDSQSGIASGQTLERTTGDHDGSYLGSITLVEVGFEINGNPPDTCIVEGLYVGSGFVNDTFSVPGSDAVSYLDVTALKTWGWSDFNGTSDLQASIAYSAGTSMECDQLFYRLTYLIGGSGIGKVNVFNRIAGSGLS